MLERYTREGHRDGVRLIFPEGEGRAKQEFREETDVNFILRNFAKTGAVAHFQKHGSNYGFAPAVDFQAAMETVKLAEVMFSDLPGKVRQRFGHDPAAFLEFVQDPENADEMRELGLREPVAADGPPGSPGRPDRQPPAGPPEVPSAAPAAAAEDPPAQ